MIQAIPPTTLPRPIRQALRKVDVRLRSSASARGLGIALLVAAILASAGMAADFAWSLPTPIRWATWGLWVSAVGLIAILGVVRPWLRRSRWGDLAAVAERFDSGLGERLTGSIALIDGEAPTNGSPALVAALADQAAGFAANFDPSRVKGAGHPTAKLVLGMAAIGLVAAPIAARPDPFRTLALRFFAPWRDLDRVGWFALSVTPGDQFAGIGTDVRIEAKLTPRFGSKTPPEAAWLEWADEKGRPHRTLMAVKPSDESDKAARSFETTLPRLAGSMTYRVSTEPATSRRYKVTAVDPPTVAALSARVEPPAYTKLPPFLAKDPGRVEALEGSQIRLTIASAVPVERFEVRWPTGPTAPPRVVEAKPNPDGKSAVATAEAEASGPFVLTLKGGPHGVDGRPESRTLVVRADAAPTLAVQGSTSAREASPSDVVQLGIAARDDFAVASAEVHYEIRRKGSEGESKTGHVALKLDGLGSTLAKGVGSLALRDLGLEPGDAIAYRVRVADNRPAPKGPNVVWSDPRAISIVANAESMIARDDRARREGFQSRLDEIRKAATANRRETEQLRYAADAARRNNATWDEGRQADLAAREAEARGVEDKLQLLARDLQDDPTFNPLARPTRQAAEVEAEAGRAQLDEAKKAADASKRLAELRQADARLGALGNRLDEIARQFDALAKLDLDRQKLRDLAAREDALAAKAEQGAEKAKLAAEQDDLRKALDALLAQSPGLRAAVLAAQAEEAAKLAKEARELAERQRAESRKTAEGQPAGGPLRQLAQDQKDLEDDARRLALDINEPLGENGRGGLDADSVRKAVDPIERGDLADAVRKLDEAENNLRRVAQDVEDVPGDPKALARRLARRQDHLANDANSAVAEARRKDLKPEEHADLARQIKPLADREADIAKLAAGIVPPEAQKGAAKQAVEAAEKALANLKEAKPRETENAQNDAKRALNQLAEALPDPGRARQRMWDKINEAKRKEEEVLNQIERNLNETFPNRDKPDADAKAAADLAEKIAPLVQKQKEAADALAKLEVEPRLEPQRDRAAARAGRLADQIQAVKNQAPPKRGESKATPPARWHVLGPFPGNNAKPPFDPTRPVDLDAKVDGPDGKPREWKPAPIDGGNGMVDLGKLLTRTDNHTAFAVAEIPSPKARKARLSIGSDDTLIVWLNGKKVFETGASRSFQPDQDKVEVDLVEGANRLVIRCGNGNGEWQFAVNATPPPPDGFDPEKAQALRESLAAARVDAQAALYRLESKGWGRMPADDLAEVLAGEAKAAAARLADLKAKPADDDPTPREKAAEDRRRIAAALRNLPVAVEAPTLQAEAVRLADEAAKPDADPEAARLAAEAAQALARRLGDELTPRELARALAQAERALQAPENRADPARVAERQKAIAAELSHPAADPNRPADADSKPDAEQVKKAEQAEKAVRQAADLARRAERGDPAAPTPAALAGAEGRAAEALEAMAGEKPKAEVAANPNANANANANPDPDARPPGPADPELGLGKEEAAKAAELATRQRQIRERLQAAMAERVGPQQELRQDSREIARELADLRDRARDVNSRWHDHANGPIARLGDHAPRAMDRGAENLAKGQLDQARGAQREAADNVEVAARDIEDLAAGLRAEAAEAPGQQPGQGQGEPANGLARAQESLRDLARRLAQPNDQGQPQPGGNQADAAEMKQAADALRMAARPKPGSLDAPPMALPDPDNPDPTPSAAGRAEADLAALQDLVRKKTGRQWGELPGHLRTEILQLSKGKYRDDYARLIQLYFKEIAADASKPGMP